MAKTLIIKGADFSTNKLDKVYFGEIPCEGISIDSTAQIYGLGNTITLVPVLTPANTTDNVTWTSSDDDVATVSGGIITSHRYGTATITAVCGNYSASCTITIAIQFVDALASKVQISTYGSHELIDAIVGENGTASRFVAIGSAQKDDMFPVSCVYQTGDVSGIYPIQIPDGAKTITFEMENFGCVVTYMDGKTKSIRQIQDRTRDSAKVLDGETAASGTDWSISSWTFDQRTLTIPVGLGINSFALTLYSKNDSAYNNYNINNLTITFGYE